MATEPKPPEQLSAELSWLLPRQHGEPAECLQRIRWLCEQIEGLHELMLVVGATHQGIPRASLASAIRQFRPELHQTPPDDVHSLLNGLLNGGKDGFEAVQRSRKSASRRSGGMPFLRPD